MAVLEEVLSGEVGFQEYRQSGNSSADNTGDDGFEESHNKILNEFSLSRNSIKQA
jgi:hypothetical protein